MIALNDNEIVILGGKASTALSDVFKFNITNKTFQKVANGGDYKFQSAGDSQAVLFENSVIALVQNSFTPSLISWT